MRQRDGEHIRAFAWRVDMAHGLRLTYVELSRRVLRGLSPAITPLLTKLKRSTPWTLDSLFELADNLDEHLSADDPYLKSHFKHSGF